MQILFIFSIILLLMLSAIFSGSETSYFSLSELEKRRLLKSKNIKRQYAGQLLERPRALLLTILIGNMLVNIGLSTINASLFGEKLGFAVILSTVLLLVFGEITPKKLALLRSENFASNTSRFLKFCKILFMPFRIVLEKFSAIFLPEESGRVVDEAEIKTAIEESFQAGWVTSRLKKLADKVLELDKIDLSDLSIPMESVDIISQDNGYDIDSIFDDKSREEPLQALIITGESQSIIKSVYYWSDFLAGRGESNFVVLGDSTYALNGFNSLIEKQAKFIVLVDEYGKVTGFVPGKKILSMVFTPQTAEDKTTINFSKIGKSFIIPGQTRISDVEDALSRNIEHTRVMTIGGFILENLGHIPKKGESFEIQGLRIRIIHSTEKTIEMLAIRPLEDDEESINV
ncbi:MAG: CNNM domain-containing protein [Candidatus Zixiibacteriota bacterium]